MVPEIALPKNAEELAMAFINSRCKSICKASEG